MEDNSKKKQSEILFFHTMRKKNSSKCHPCFRLGIDFSACLKILEWLSIVAIVIVSLRRQIFEEPYSGDVSTGAQNGVFAEK